MLRHISQHPLPFVTHRHKMSDPLVRDVIYGRPPMIQLQVRGLTTRPHMPRLGK